MLPSFGPDRRRRLFRPLAGVLQKVAGLIDNVEDTVPADLWKVFRIVERYARTGIRLLYRADAAFAKPEIYDYLEERVIGYAM